MAFINLEDMKCGRLFVRTESCRLASCCVPSFLKPKPSMVGAVHTVSIKHALRTAGYGLGIKHGLMINCGLPTAFRAFYRPVVISNELILHNTCSNENKPSRMQVLCDQFICFRSCWREANFTPT